jgi:hypothetical protein
VLPTFHHAPKFIIMLPNFDVFSLENLGAW